MKLINFGGHRFETRGRLSTIQYEWSGIDRKRFKATLHSCTMLQHTLDISRNVLSDRVKSLGPAELLEASGFRWPTEEIPLHSGVGVDEFGNNEHINIDAALSCENLS